MWARRLHNLAEQRELQLATICLDGEMAAYVLAVRDGRTVRVLDGRYVERWARYARGRLLEAELVRQVRTSVDLDDVDWMTTIAPDSLLGANATDPMVLIAGTSAS